MGNECKFNLMNYVFGRTRELSYPLIFLKQGRLGYWPNIHYSPNSGSALDQNDPSYFER